MKPKKLTYTAMIFLLVVIIVMSFYVVYTSKENEILTTKITEQEEQIISLQLDNGCTELENKRLMKELAVEKGKLEKIAEDFAVEKLVLAYAKEKIITMADYIEFMQALCEVNGLHYPYFNEGDYDD